MKFWVLILTIFFLSSVLLTAKLFICKKIEEKREFYTFKNEEGEEIPIGI